MKKSVRLASVVKIAESEEQKAIQAFGYCQQQLEVHKGRLRQLTEYRNEYQTQFDQRAGNGISVAQMQSYRAFISQLDLGIEEQNRVIGSTTLELEAKRREWFSKRTKTKAIDKVIEQHVTKEQAQESKRDQKECDERSHTRHCGQIMLE